MCLNKYTTVINICVGHLHLCGQNDMNKSIITLFSYGVWTAHCAGILIFSTPFRSNKQNKIK